MKISRDLFTFLGLTGTGWLTTVEAQQLSGSKITEMYWSNTELPDKSSSSRGIQWHQCGQKPKTPKNAKDVVCHGDRCYVICDKGAKRQSRSITKCQKKKGGFKWTHNELNGCAACEDLPKASNDLITNCQFRGTWGNKGLFRV